MDETPKVVAAQQVSDVKPTRKVRTRRPITTTSPDFDMEDVPITPRRRPATRKTKPNAKNILAPHSRKGYKYDWPMAQRLFVEGILPENADPTSESREYTTLKQLSDRLKIPYDTMRTRASEERWYDLRQDYMLRMSKARQAKRIAELSKESFEFDQNTLKVAKLGMGMITARMSEIAREVQEQQRRRDNALKIAEAGYDIDPNDLKTVIDARELNTLSQAAVQWQLLGQKALGTDITRMEIQHDIQVGMDVDVEVTTIAAELGREDPDRLAAFLQAAKRAGLLELVMNQDAEQQAIEADPDGVVDAEIVSEETA